MALKGCCGAGIICGRMAPHGCGGGITEPMGLGIEASIGIVGIVGIIGLGVGMVVPLHGAMVMGLGRLGIGPQGPVGPGPIGRLGIIGSPPGMPCGGPVGGPGRGRPGICPIGMHGRAGGNIILPN